MRALLAAAFVAVSGNSQPARKDGVKNANNDDVVDVGKQAVDNDDVDVGDEGSVRTITLVPVQNEGDFANPGETVKQAVDNDDVDVGDEGSVKTTTLVPVQNDGDATAKHAVNNDDVDVGDEGSVRTTTLVPVQNDGDGANTGETVKQAVDNDDVDVGDEISKKDEEISKKDEEISKKDEEISKKDEEISKKDEEISKKDEEISKKDEEISKKDDEGSVKTTTLVPVQNDGDGANSGETEKQAVNNDDDGGEISLGQDEQQFIDSRNAALTGLGAEVENAISEHRDKLGKIAAKFEGLKEKREALIAEKETRYADFKNQRKSVWDQIRDGYRADNIIYENFKTARTNHRAARHNLRLTRKSIYKEYVQFYNHANSRSNLNALTSDEKKTRYAGFENQLKSVEQQIADEYSAYKTIYANYITARTNVHATRVNLGLKLKSIAQERIDYRASLPSKYKELGNERSAIWMEKSILSRKYTELKNERFAIRMEKSILILWEEGADYLTECEKRRSDLEYAKDSTYGVKTCGFQRTTRQLGTETEETSDESEGSQDTQTEEDSDESEASQGLGEGDVTSSAAAILLFTILV